jgi:hypothetical protein
MDGYPGYNHFFITKNNVSKTIFKCSGLLGMNECLVMSFGLKNIDTTYQRTMNLIFYNMIKLYHEDLHQ